MHQSPIWVVEDNTDFRGHNKKAFTGRQVLRQKQEEERRERIEEARHKRSKGANHRRRKYEQPQEPERKMLSEWQATNSQEIPGESIDVVLLAELLDKEEPDYIDEEENAALEVALSTRSVEAVIGFSTTLSTPTAHHAPRISRALVSGCTDEDIALDNEDPFEGEVDYQPADDEKRDSATWGGPDAADNDDVDSQNEHWRKVQVRTPVDVPLDLLPATQRLETLQVQEDMKIFSDETSKQAPPPKRYLRSAWWLPRSKWRVMDPADPSTLQNPHRPRDFSAEGHTYLPMGQELVRSGVAFDKLADDDQKIADNEKLIENSTVGKRYKEFLISEGFQDGKHLPHYLDSCKVAVELDQWRGVRQAVQVTNALMDNVKAKAKVAAKWSRSPTKMGSSPRSSPSPHASVPRTPRLPDINTPRNM